jgi:uracil-DNA glycosylase family 4
MIINKNPWDTELEYKACLSDADGELLFDLMQRLKIERLDDFYLTHLVKFKPPNFKTTLKASWVNDGMHLLMQEIKIVQPKYILCLGTDASKAILGPQASVTDMLGQVGTFRYNTAYTAELAETSWQEAKVITVVHPKQVIRDQSALRQLESGLARFAALLRGADLGETETVNHVVVDNHAQLFDLLVNIEQDPEKSDDVIAVDAEWHGQHPVNHDTYMRTIQFAWRPKHAIGIKLHDAGGDVTLGFCGTPQETNARGILQETIKLLNVFFKGGRYEHANGAVEFRRKRVIGHFFNADLEWLVDYGIDLQECFMAPLYDYTLVPGTKLHKLYAEDGFKAGEVVPAWYRTKYEGGADTGLMAHAIEETAKYNLETLAMRYTTAPRYDRELDKWKIDYCRQQGLSSSDLEGYGMCPDEILLPYGMYDADVTLRLKITKVITAGRPFGNLRLLPRRCWKFTAPGSWSTAPAWIFLRPGLWTHGQTWKIDLKRKLTGQSSTCVRHSTFGSFYSEKNSTAGLTRKPGKRSRFDHQGQLRLN